MKTIAENHAAELHADAGAAPAPLILEAIACDLRGLYSAAAAELPECLLALTRRLDRDPPGRAATAA